MNRKTDRLTLDKIWLLVDCILSNLRFETANKTMGKIDIGRLTQMMRHSPGSAFDFGQSIKGYRKINKIHTICYIPYTFLSRENNELKNKSNE